MDTGEKEEGNSDEALLNEHSFCESAEIFDPLSIKTETRDECDEFDINEMHHDYLNKHIKNEPLSPINNQCQSSYNFNEHFEEETEFSDVVNAIVSPTERRNSFSFNANLKIKTEFPENNSIEESPENPYSPDSASESEAWNRTFATGKSNDEIFSISRVDVDQDAEHNIVQMVVNDAEEETPSDSGQKFMVTENGLKSQRKTEREILAKLGLDKDISEEQGKEDGLSQETSLLDISIDNDAYYKQGDSDDFKSYCCSFCDYKSHRLYNIKRHNITVHQGVKLCNLCKKPTFSLKDHSCECRPILCHICGQLITTESGFRYHMKVVHRFSEHKCEECDRVFQSAKFLADHIAFKHLEQKVYHCDFCQKEFATARGKNDHMKKGKCHTEKVEDSVTCEICFKEFKCVSTRTEHHNRMHLGKRNQCEKCGMSFKWRSSLSWHRNNSVCSGKKKEKRHYRPRMNVEDLNSEKDSEDKNSNL